MLINFNRIRIHNFLSIGDADISLDGNGVVLVEGENRNKLDSSSSNGSGKSSIFNAICWALTGETIQGVSSDIINIYADDGCFVCLNFEIDNNLFEITRIKETNKSDLKIVKDGVDISGKGLRESSKILEKLLPDLTGDLIGSIIILGQGLPHRFSNNTPAGRKEILERLSKSDFMIEDLKDRLSTRKGELDTLVKNNETDRVKEQTLLSTYVNSIEDTTHKLNELKECGLEDTTPLQEQVDKLTAEKERLTIRVKSFEDTIKAKTSALQSLTSVKEEKLKELRKDNYKKVSEITTELESVMKDIDVLQSDISSNESGICPVCGQRLPHKHFDDLEEMKANLAELEVKRDSLNDTLEQLKSDYENKVAEIDEEYSSVAIGNLINELTMYRNNANAEFIKVSLNCDKISKRLYEINYRNQTYADSIKQLEETLNLNLVRKQQSEEKIVYYNEKEQELSVHLDVINQMLTIVKRDFRGYLLTNVIDYISLRANDYSDVVFGNRLITFTLVGNNIDIRFNDKPYENLSGGERQKVDLILQFAIRDMLNTYLNVHCNILVLDEIFDNLDAVGCAKVLNLISTIDDINSIYIISHHANELKIPYDVKIKVVKDNSGISKVVL